MHLVVLSGPPVCPVQGIWSLRHWAWDTHLNQLTYPHATPSISHAEKDWQKLLWPILQASDGEKNAWQRFFLNKFFSSFTNAPLANVCFYSRLTQHALTLTDTQTATHSYVCPPGAEATGEWWPKHQTSIAKSVALEIASAMDEPCCPTRMTMNCEPEGCWGSSAMLSFIWHPSKL